jgi:glutamine synthetase
MELAQPDELQEFLAAHPDIELLELLMPDMNGLLRCKRLQRREFEALYAGEFSVPVTVPLLGIRGDLYPGVSQELIGGDPDQLLRPVAGTLAPVPWLDSPTAQVMTAFVDAEGHHVGTDARAPLLNALRHYRARQWSPVVATELEFYLLAPGEGERPTPLTGRVSGTSMPQQGIQYCMADDLIDCDAFLEDVRRACELQGVPLTAIHSEFSPGQWEINTHHQEDVVLAACHALLLRRIVKGVARRHGWSATFMAKPFADIAGSGMHIHASLYDAAGANVFAAEQEADPPLIGDTLRHAIGGLAATVRESMAIFAPNANSYRRFTPGEFAPATTSWGYDHREVALRIPASRESQRRVEHRIAGADANPFLTVAAVLAGMLHGIEEGLEPAPPVSRVADLSDAEVTLPTRLDAALACFREATVLPRYLGKDYCDLYATLRQGESDDYHGQVPDLDYQWYLRAL